jgi:hypothetical protein
MAGTFTFTGTLTYGDGVTPIVGASVRVSMPDYPDTVGNILYSGGASAMTDTAGHFSMTLISEPDIRYVVSCDRATFGSVPFLPSGVGSTLDLSDVIASAGGGDILGPTIDGGTP